MSYRVLNKKDFIEFLDNLSRDYHVFGPAEKEPGQFAFVPMEDPAKVVMDYVHTVLPPKKFFFPQRETLLTFDLSEAQPRVEAVIEHKPQAIVGIHPCDLHGIQRLDTVFEDENSDPYYVEKRQSALLVGVNCMPDEQCFCTSMGTMKPPENGFDLFLTDIGDSFAVEIGSIKGEETLDKHARTSPLAAADIAKINNWYEKKQSSQKLAVKIQVDHLPLLFEGEYRDKIWNELGERCLSCGACNLVCPTCYCFDVTDEVSLANQKRGERQRFWDGCQLEEFAMVAGGENFRHNRSDRNRHRFYRKFLYPVLKYKKTFCVACGRCVRSCLVHISVVDTVNHFVEKSLTGGAK